MVLEKTLVRVPWTARRSNWSILKEINPEYSLEGLMLKLQYFGQLMWTANSPEKKSPEKDWGQEKKEAAEDEMVRWYYRFNRHEFEQTSGDNGGQGSLACCSPWGRKESDTTERLNKNNKKWIRSTGDHLLQLISGKGCWHAPLYVRGIKAGHREGSDKNQQVSVLWQAG